MSIFYYKTQYTPAKRALGVSLLKPSKMKCRFRIEKEIEFFTSDPSEKKIKPEPDKHILELSRQGMQYKIEYFPARDRDWRRAKKFDGQSIDVYTGKSGELLLVLPDQTLLWPRGTPKKWGRLLSVE